MADGSGSGPLAGPVRGGILRDPVDLRDRAYEPTLARLAAELLPDARLLAALRKSRRYWKLPRQQGDEGTCGGQALAGLIDIERLRFGHRRCTSVSARMLYQTARLKYDPDEPEGVSLRDVIKAFYNYGVCSEKRWPYVPRELPPGAIDVERAREARNVTLGAYYRLRPNLNTYHAALHEAEALLVSAELHDGWLPERVAAAKGEIVPPKPGERSPVLGAESHALLIVGYTSKGFLVLNSWGRDWGGWSPGGDAAPIPGVALWQYGDWADRIMDGWVLRLGAGAADAFEYSIGDMGLGFGSDTAARSTPIHAILGNFLHLDDGEFVTTGEHVSGIQTLAGDRAAADREEDGRGGAADLRRRPARPQARRRADRPLEAAGAAGGLAPVHRPLVRRLRRAGARGARRGLRRGDDPRRQARAAVRPRRRGNRPRRRPRALARHRLRRRARCAPRRAAARAGARRGADRRGARAASGCASSPSSRAPSRSPPCSACWRGRAATARRGRSSTCSSRSISSPRR